jgi:hypothetical protein
MPPFFAFVSFLFFALALVAFRWGVEERRCVHQQGAVPVYICLSVIALLLGAVAFYAAFRVGIH